MKYLTQLTVSSLFMATSLSIVAVSNSAIAEGLTSPSVKTGFVQVPSLISTDTSDRDPNTRNATYSFQISVPKEAGASLQKVTIAQKDPIEPITFASDRTTAYIQEPSGDRTTIETTTEIDPNTRAVSVIFTSPVAVGKTVIVGLRPVSNPSLEGEYVFGITAFNNSQESQGQLIGYGRLGIYNTFFYGALAPTF